MITLVEDSLAKFNTTVSTLMGRVKDIDKRIQELGSMQNNGTASWGVAGNNELRGSRL